MREFLFDLFKRFKFGKDQLPQEEVVANIESAIEFNGAKLWLLMHSWFWTCNCKLALCFGCALSLCNQYCILLQ